MSDWPIPTPVYTARAIYFSTYLFVPGVQHGTVALFRDDQGETGQGFSRPLSEAEVGNRGSGLVFAPTKLTRIEWDVFPVPPSDEWDLGSHPPDLVPLEARALGLLLYGGLQFCPQPADGPPRWIPLTAGLPFGNISDHIGIRGGMDLQDAPILMCHGFRYEVLVKVSPGFAPVVPVGLRVHLHMLEARKNGW